MRPTPSETADGLRRVLKEVVAPELTSDHARQRLEEVRVVLGQVDWDDAGLLLQRRVAALQELLGLQERLATSYQDLQTQHEALAASALAQVAARPEDEVFRARLTQLLLA